jgi:hypothetical protein
MKKICATALVTFSLFSAWISGCVGDAADLPEGTDDDMVAVTNNAATDATEDALGANDGTAAGAISAAHDAPVPVDVDEAELQAAGLEAIPMAEEEAACAAGNARACEVAEAAQKAVGPAAASDCRSYYGTCTGIWKGTSCAYGEGYQYCATGSFLYTFITFCGDYGSYPNSWGIGACLW